MESREYQEIRRKILLEWRSRYCRRWILFLRARGCRGRRRKGVR